METFQSFLAKRLADALAAADLPECWRSHAGDRSALRRLSDQRRAGARRNSAVKIRANAGGRRSSRILEVGEWCDPPTIAGAGFINFTLRADAIASQDGARSCRDERLGVAKAQSTKRIVIDFGSPNVAKPMHVGHIRSTVLGDALARIASFLGHDVIRDNHIGDWGTQFGMVIYGWKNLLDRAALAARSDRRDRSHLQGNK